MVPKRRTDGADGLTDGEKSFAAAGNEAANFAVTFHSFTLPPSAPPPSSPSVAAGDRKVVESY